MVSKDSVSLTVAELAVNYPYGIYVENTDFVSGAVDQVNYTFRKLGGDILTYVSPASSLSETIVPLAKP